jgi:hypothetical protein
MKFMAPSAAIVAALSTWSSLVDTFAGSCTKVAPVGYVVLAPGHWSPGDELYHVIH